MEKEKRRMLKATNVCYREKTMRNMTLLLVRKMIGGKVESNVKVGIGAEMSYIGVRESGIAEEVEQDNCKRTKLRLTYEEKNVCLDTIF